MQQFPPRISLSGVTKKLEVTEPWDTDAHPDIYEYVSAPEVQHMMAKAIEGAAINVTNPREYKNLMLRAQRVRDGAQVLLPTGE